MELAAKDGLLLRALLPEGRFCDPPFNAHLEDVVELDDGDRQTINDAVRVFGQVERLDTRLSGAIDDQREVAATAVEPRTFGLVWEQIAIFASAAQQDGFSIPPAALANNRHHDQLSIGTGGHRTGACDMRSERGK